MAKFFNDLNPAADGRPIMYLNFFGLRDEPFRLSPDPRYLHLGGPHQQVLRTLVRGISGRKGFIVATGPVGTGKTTLLNVLLQLIRRYGNGKIDFGILVNPMLNRDEFFEAILDEFGIECPSTSKNKRLSALMQKLVATRQHGGTTVLIIDEAHLLSVELLEEIRLLGNMETYGEKLLQVVLCGQPELAPLLLKPELRALRQRISLIANLRSLTMPETRAYIRRRLACAGLSGENPFTPAVAEIIFFYTRGVPRLINSLCDECLRLGYEGKTRIIEAETAHYGAKILGLLAPPSIPLRGQFHDPQVTENEAVAVPVSEEQIAGLGSQS